MKSRVKNFLRNYFGFGLTKEPTSAFASISDLFFWTKLLDLTIFYEYIGIYDLFNASVSTTSRDDCTIVFFDSEGNVITSKVIACSSLSRKSINITSYLSSFDCDFGSFSVFHNTIPSSVLASSSFLAERGYVGYSLPHIAGKSYVHGNLDAVAYYNLCLEPLGVTSLFNNSYFLQALFSPDQQVYISLVNPSNRAIKIKLYAIPLGQFECSQYLTNFLTLDSTVHFKTIHLNSLGSQFILIPPNLCPCRIVIKSHLPMARPTCFVLKYNHLNVYHG